MIRNHLQGSVQANWVTRMFQALLVVLPTFTIQIGQELNDSIINMVLSCSSLVVCYWFNYLNYGNAAGCPYDYCI